MITGPKTAIKAVRKLTDTQSGLPDKTVPEACKCGSHRIYVDDDDADQIACVKCGRVTGLGSRGGFTLRVHRDRQREKSALWECECDAETEAKIKAAKAKPSASQAADEKVLAAVSVEAKPEPKEAKVLRDH